MSLREFEYTDGTSLRLKGNLHEGRIAVDLEGFNIDRALTQKEIIEYNPSEAAGIDLRYGNIYKVNLTANIPALTLTNGDVGTYTFIFVQDSTGGRTVTFSGNFYFPSSMGAPNFGSDAAGTINVVTFLHDKINFYGTYLQTFTSI